MIDVDCSELHSNLQLVKWTSHCIQTISLAGADDIHPNRHASFVTRHKTRLLFFLFFFINQ